jgi:hypothetical protein
VLKVEGKKEVEKRHKTTEAALFSCMDSAVGVTVTTSTYQCETSLNSLPKG